MFVDGFFGVVVVVVDVVKLYVEDFDVEIGCFWL